MDATLGCRWCPENFVLPSELWSHVQRAHPREFVQATTRRADEPSRGEQKPGNCEEMITLSEFCSLPGEVTLIFFARGQADQQHAYCRSHANRLLRRFPHCYREEAACTCPCHTSQVDECFCTPACVRGEPEE